MPHVTVGDGTGIYYESHGDESLPTVVFIRGTGADGTRWMPQVRAYESEVRCVIFDGRGVGRSETTPPPYSVQSMAGDTFDLMDALGIGAAHLSGSSLGGAIGLRMAADAPERVLSLQTHSSWLGTHGFSEFSLGLLKAHLVNGGVEHYYSATLPMLISPGFMSRNFEMLMNILSHMKANAASYDGLLGQIEANLSYDMRPEAPQGHRAHARHRRRDGRRPPGAVLGGDPRGPARLRLPRLRRSRPPLRHGKPRRVQRGHPQLAPPPPLSRSAQVAAPVSGPRRER